MRKFLEDITWRFGILFIYFIHILMFEREREGREATHVQLNVCLLRQLAQLSPLACLNFVFCNLGLCMGWFKRVINFPWIFRQCGV